MRQEVGDGQLLAALRRVDAGASSTADAVAEVRRARAESACRSILRRCPKAASTSAKVATRFGLGAGQLARSKPTRIESTFGTGQNTCRLTMPAVRQRPYQAAFTLGRAVDLRPRGRRRSAARPRPAP